jgi:hypothetical protein
VRGVLDARPGPAPVEVHLGAANGSSPRLRSRSLRVVADEETLDALRTLVGKGRVRLVRAGG